MIFDHSILKDYLKAELNSRVSANPRYSLRAFANRLGLAPSTAVEVLNGRKNLSVDRAAIVADALQLTPNEKKYFLWMACLDSTADAFFRDMVQEQMASLRALEGSAATPRPARAGLNSGHLPIN